MEVLYPRCAGLDVHKDTVVACVRLVADGHGADRGSHVRHDDTRTAGVVGLADRARLHPRRHGGHRRLLEAGLAHALGWRHRR